MPVRNEADPEWERYKTIIESLYVKGNLRGLMDTMERDHGFSKKKSQYESQFKIWGTRKYRKKDEWKSIGRNIAERKRAGKESDVYFKGEPILNSKVQKETRRHGFMTALEQNRPAPIPPIPHGFEIRTPPAEVVPLTAIPGDTPSLPVGTETRGCAYAQLQIVSSPLTSQTMTTDASLAVPRVSMSPSTPMVTSDLSPIQRQKAIFYTPYAPELYESPVDPFEDQKNYFRRLSHASHLPFCQFEDALHAQFGPPPVTRSVQVSGPKLTLETSLLAEYHHDVSHSDVNVLHKMLKGPEMLNAVFNALMPSEDDQMILRSDYSGYDSASSKMFSLLIFAMANNFAGVYTVPIEDIMHFLNRHASSRLLQHILSTSGPESEAFAEKLFEAAILMEEAHIVKVLLQQGLVPNDLICVHRGGKYTPLEYSSMVWNVEITKLLLDAKLDVNKSIEGDKGSGGATARALIGEWRDNEHSHVPIPSEIVHMLLEAGGRFSWSELATWRLQDNQEVFDLLLDHAFKTKTYDQAWYNLAFAILEKCDNATATRTVTRFFEAGIAPETMERATRSPMSGMSGRFCDIPIDIAAERGNFELVRLLLHSGVPSTIETLTYAIRSRNKETIKFLLDDGADVFAFEESATEHRHNTYIYSYSPVPSPLSEAIRWGDDEILDLLRLKGAWSRIVNKVALQGEFEDVLIAASVRGKLTTVRELLNYRPPNTYGKDLSDALVAAIYLNEDAIVLTLLDAGANVNGGLYIASDIDTAMVESSDSASKTDAGTYEDFRERSHRRSQRGPALVEALLQRNERLVRLILDADVYYGDHGSSRTEFGQQSTTSLEAAVEWGNLSIIEEVILIGITRDSKALEIAVRRKDRQCMQLLVNAGVEISPTTLDIAVTNNDTEMVEYLFSVGAYPAIPDALYEIEALPNGLPMIERLLTEFSRRYPHGRSHNCFENCNDEFQKAIRKGNIVLIELLLKAKIAVDFNFEMQYSNDEFRSQDYSLSPSTTTLLGEAITQRHTTSLAILQMLLSEVGNPNVVVQTSEGIPYRIRDTALLVAIDRKYRQKVQRLIAAGADVNWPATRGIKRTPLQKAAEVGSYEITELLIKEGALVNNEPAVRGGATALQLAAIGGYVGIAVLLLEKGANVNAPAAKFYGRTALEGAAEHGRIDMLKLLSNAGAEFHGDEYETALRLAKENGHIATRRYLEILYPRSEMTFMDN